MDDYMGSVQDAEVIDTQADVDAIKHLALAQALYKVIAEQVSTKVPDNLRSRVDAIMRDRYEQAKKLGIAPRSFDIEADGQKVGTYSISTTEARPEQTHAELAVDDAKALMAWALENGCVNVNMAKIIAHFESTGELPDGCSVVQRTIPAVQGGQISRTSLRIDPQKVSDALGAELGAMTQYLLGGGE